MKSPDGGLENDGNMERKRASGAERHDPQRVEKQYCGSSIWEQGQLQILSNPKTAGCRASAAETRQGCRVCGVLWASQPSL